MSRYLAGFLSDPRIGVYAIVTPGYKPTPMTYPGWGSDRQRVTHRMHNSKRLPRLRFQPKVIRAAQLVQPVRHWYWDRAGFGLLFINLVLLTMVLPMIDSPFMGHRSFVVLTSLCAVTAPYAARRGSRLLLGVSVTAAITCGIAMGLALAPASLVWGDSDTIITVRMGLHIFFLALMIAALSHEILRSSHLSGDRVLGACCVYLLLGLTWSFAYTMIEHAMPGSFAIAEERLSNDDHRSEIHVKFSVFMHYSFVTLSTVGTSEVTARTGLGRTLGWLEAVTGQLFMAILVARLVGLNAASFSADSKPSSPGQVAA